MSNRSDTVKPVRFIYSRRRACQHKHIIMSLKADLLENLNLTGVRLVFHSHPLQIFRFSVKGRTHLIWIVVSERQNRQVRSDNSFTVHVELSDPHTRSSACPALSAGWRCLSGLAEESRVAARSPVRRFGQ